MSVLDFPGGKPKPTVAELDHATVIATLSRHSCNVTEAAKELNVSASDLRRLILAHPQMQDQAFEAVEARLDKAEANIHEALYSDDSRRRDAASFFVLRNTARAKKRGWIVSASGGVEASVAVAPRTITFRWRTDDDPDPTDDFGAGKLIEHAPDKD
jgi:hypothetical protein